MCYMMMMMMMVMVMIMIVMIMMFLQPRKRVARRTSNRTTVCTFI